VEGLAVLASGSTDTMNVTIQNNDLQTDTASTNSYLGLELTSGGSSGSDTICANVSGNVRFDAGTNGAAGVQTEVLGSGHPVIELQGYSGAANNAGQIVSFLNTTATTVNPAANDLDLTGGTGTVKAAPSPCPTPP
jgi:hypothetical protein